MRTGTEKIFFFYMALPYLILTLFWVLKNKAWLAKITPSGRLYPVSPEIPIYKGYYPWNMLLHKMKSRLRNNSYWYLKSYKNFQIFTKKFSWAIFEYEIIN